MQKLKLSELHQYGGEVLTKDQMKKVMGGVLSNNSCSGTCDYNWKDAQGHSHTTAGSCLTAGDKNQYCYCSNGEGQC